LVLQQVQQLLTFSFFGKMQKGHHAVQWHQASKLVTELVVSCAKVKVGPREASLADCTQAGLKVKQASPAQGTVAGENKV
jgi:hypothetical protein